jgi:hypothetical protein
LTSAAAGLDGAMIEVHPEPDRSVSDAAQTIDGKLFTESQRASEQYALHERAKLPSPCYDFEEVTPMEMPPGPYCQSCGMPLSRDEEGAGTEADGRKSAIYCSHCYQGGAFTEPDQTLARMETRVDFFLREMNVPDEIREKAVSGIASLERWRS